MSHTNIPTPYLEFSKVKRNLIIVLTAAVATPTLLILVSPGNISSILGDVLRSSSGGVAATLALLVVFKQGLDGLFGKGYAALAIGISLWFAAELVWTIYEIVLGVNDPFPSLADPLWIIGYVPFVYFMFTTYKISVGSVKLAQIIVISLGAGIFFIFFTYQLLVNSDLSTTSGIVEFLISIAYPLGDLIFIVPALGLILNSGKGKLTSIPWIFLAMLITAGADSVFGYTSVANIAADRAWNPIYIAGYLLFAAGLFWYNRFFIVPKKSC